MVGLPPIEADQKLCRGATLHSTYLVKNHVQGGSILIASNRAEGRIGVPGVGEESVGNPWYTEDGAEAARRADIIRGPDLPADGGLFVEGVTTMPFSLLLLLDPQLSAIGYGSYCEGNDCAATLPYKYGLSKSQFFALYTDTSEAHWNPALGAVPFTSARLRKPIEFPPDRASVSHAEYDGGGAPDPRTSCPGYTLPMGPPIILELGAPAARGGGDVVLGSFSITDSGTPVEACGFDATNYANPNGLFQRTGRRIMQSFGAVIIMPREPLTPGHTYAVTVNADSTEYRWSFSVAPASHLAANLP